MGTLHEDQYTLLIISRSFLRRMKNVLETKFVEKIETHILYSIAFFDNLAIYEIMWKNVLERDRPQLTV
jgi:hypothetical protein